MRQHSSRGASTLLFLLLVSACSSATGLGSEGNDAQPDDAAGELHLDLAPEDLPESADLPANDADPTEHNPDFVGTWMVDQPTHALYEYTLYTFHPDGALVEGASEPLPGSGGHPTPTGRVARCLTHDPEYGYCTEWSEVECLFGDQWSSRGPTVLVIAGQCSDGRARDIVLVEAGPVAENLPGFSPAVESVGGEDGWAHNSWDWRFVPCSGETVDTCQ